MYRPAFEAADHAIAVCEAEVDRRIGKAARKGLWKLIGLAIFATPIVWMIAGFTIDGRAVAGLIVGLALYALLLCAEPVLERLRGTASASFKWYLPQSKK